MAKQQGVLPCGHPPTGFVEGTIFFLRCVLFFIDILIIGRTRIVFHAVHRQGVICSLSCAGSRSSFLRFIALFWNDQQGSAKVDLLPSPFSHLFPIIVSSVLLLEAPWRPVTASSTLCIIFDIVAGYLDFTAGRRLQLG